MRKILPSLAGAAIAVALCITLGNAQPAPGFSKTAPLSGTGSNGAPLKINVCANNEVLKSNGTAWICAAAASGVTDGDKGDITVTSSGVTWTIDPNVVDFAKQADIATARIVGRVTAGTGDPEALTSAQVTANFCDTFSTSSTTKGCVPGSNSLGATRYLDGTGAWSIPPGAGDITGLTSSTPMNINGLDGGSCASGTCALRLTDGDRGDLTLSGNGVTWTVDPDAIGYSKIQNVTATNRFLGRITAGAGDIEELTGTQATSLLDTFSTSSTTKGVVPGSNGASTSCLKGDGTWGACGGGASAQSVSTTGNVDDLSLSAGVTTLIFTGTGATTLRGIARSGGNVNGDCIDVINSTTSTLSFDHEAGTSTAANRFSLSALTNWVTTVNAVTRFCYETADARWRTSKDSRMSSLFTDGTIQAGTSGSIGTSLAVGTYMQAQTNIYAGTTDAVYMMGGAGSLNFGLNTNATYTGKINAVGYNEGTTQFRDFKLQDGKGADVISVVGSTKAVDFAGPITFNASNNVGNELALSGTFAANGTSNSIGNASTDTLTLNAKFVDAGTLPTLSSCGTSSRTGGQWSFTITPGTVTACTATFANACSNAPTCSVTPGYASTTAIPYVSSVSASAITVGVTGTGWSGSQTVHVVCICH